MENIRIIILKLKIKFRLSGSSDLLIIRRLQWSSRLNFLNGLLFSLKSLFSSHFPKDATQHIRSDSSAIYSFASILHLVFLKISLSRRIWNISDKLRLSCLFPSRVFASAQLWRNFVTLCDVSSLQYMTKLRHDCVEAIVKSGIG